MPNLNSTQPQTFYFGQKCLMGQQVSQAFPPSDSALHRIELLFFFYLLIALSFKIFYHAYRLFVRHQCIQALEKLFQLNAPRQAVWIDGNLNPATVTSRVYEQIPLPISQPIADTLSPGDIPLGQGGFARDYKVSLTVGDQAVIELKSERFDTFVSLLASDGSTVGENDDGPDGTTNSLLVVSIFKTGIYTVRVRASNKAQEAVGPFTLFVTHCSR